MLNKDVALKFLETVTYDEMMGYDAVLVSQNEQSQNANPAWADTRKFLLDTGTDMYGWDDERELFLARLSNFHNAEVACEDWRFNYFWAITKNLPESTLEEQFPTLKKLGDELTKLKGNALIYKNRMLEILMVQDSITFLYPLIHLEDSSIELPEIEWMGKTVAWQNSSSRTVRFIKETIECHLGNIMTYSPTPDLQEKFSIGPCGQVGIVTGKIMKQTRVMGMHGVIDLTNNKLSAV